MSEGSPLLNRLTRHAHRLAAMTRPHHIAVTAAVAVVLVGLVGVRALAVPRLEPEPVGERLQIEVVAPEEPPVVPGAVMEVGELVDGFEGLPAPPLRPVIETAAYAPWDEDFDAPSSRASPKRHRDDADDQALPRTEPPARGWREGRVGRWLGFDAPDRDYRAEREERRARMEARERNPREVRYYRSDGEPLDHGPDGRLD